MVVHAGNQDKKMQEMAELKNLHLQNDNLNLEIRDFKKVRRNANISLGLAIILAVLRLVEFLITLL